MSDEPQQLLLPLLFAVKGEGEPPLDRQAVVAEKIPESASETDEEEEERP
ncbi:MAG: hypothetical protein QOJ56_2864 [Mycobacterium sp.]|jgi:hypothetical protein|nr:hypothetical protein [Mycobacterium sp.]MDT5318462.1 hypothetical protein [Mycobacterium sp.]MDT5354332.1 hypothetical protein [Mycobacterium sp.]